MTKQEVETIAMEVYQKLGSRFGVNQTPVHSHNDIDSQRIDPTSVIGFTNLPGTGTGVVSSTTLGNQIVSQGNTSRGYGRFGSVSQASFPSFPLVVINGNGVGVDSQFNGGDAPEGTLVFFQNGNTISGLWVRANGQWYGIGQATPLYGNAIA